MNESENILVEFLRATHNLFKNIYKVNVKENSQNISSEEIEKKTNFLIGFFDALKKLKQSSPKVIEFIKKLKEGNMQIFTKEFKELLDDIRRKKLNNIERISGIKINENITPETIVEIISELSKIYDANFSSEENIKKIGGIIIRKKEDIMNEKSRDYDISLFIDKIERKFGQINDIFIAFFYNISSSPVIAEKETIVFLRKFLTFMTNVYDNGYFNTIISYDVEISKTSYDILYDKIGDIIKD